MTPRRVAGLLLALWWILYPLTPRLNWSLRATHGLIAVALAFCAAALVARHRRIPLGPAVWATVVAVGSLLVATFRRPDLYPTSERWDGAVVGMSHALFFVSVWLLVPRRLHTGEVAQDDVDHSERVARRGLAAVLGIAVVAQGLVVLLQQDELSRVGGTFGNPNLFGAFVAAVALAVGAFAQWQPLAVGFGALFASLLLQTGSRGAFVAGAAVLLAFVARRRAKAACAVALGLAVLLWAVENPLTERVAMLDDDLTYSRPFLWKVGLTHAAENPLGIGAGMNKYVFPASAFDPERPWLVYQRHNVGLTHNVFVTMTLEWGWLAGAAGLGLLAWTTWRALRRGPGRLGADRLGQGAGLGAAVLLLESQVDGLEQNPLLFSLLLLFTAVAMRRIGRPEPALVLRGRMVASLLVLLACLLGSAVAGQQLLRLDNDAAAASLRAWRAGSVETTPAREVIASNVDAHPDDGHSWSTLLVFEAAVLRREVLAAGAAPVADPGASVWAALAGSRRTNPIDVDPLREAASAALLVYRKGGRDPRAFDRYAILMQDLLELDPFDVEGRHELALEAHRAGRAGLCAEQLERLFAIEPDDAFAWWVKALRAEAERRTSDALLAYSRTREAIFRARIPEGAHNPGARAAVAELLGFTEVPAIARRITYLAKMLREAPHEEAAEAGS